MQLPRTITMLAASAVALAAVASGPTVRAESPDREARGVITERSERRKPKAPRVGDAAPLFELPRYDTREPVDLADVVGRKPIVLFFGSYT